MDLNFFFLIRNKDVWILICRQLLMNGQQVFSGYVAIRILCSLTSYHVLTFSVSVLFGQLMIGKNSFLEYSTAITDNPISDIFCIIDLKDVVANTFCIFHFFLNKQIL